MTATLVIRGRGELAAQGPLDFDAARSGTDEFEGAAGAITLESDRRERVTLTVRLAP